MTDPTTAGGAYDTELIGALREEFNLEDCDAETAACAAAKEIPLPGKFANNLFEDGETPADALGDFHDLVRQMLLDENRIASAWELGADRAQARRRRLAAKLHGVIDRIAADCAIAEKQTCPDCPAERTP